ncbi:MAG: methyltransferase domain-containing protein [Gammaproteobacteria bacterium]|nr:methyltransferase domain-containing protein [Gammaproteobacteria bacterium]
MQIAHIIRRQAPTIWNSTSKIPWHEPAFSARMLREHLDQSHDRASRRHERIDAHVQWLQSRILGSQSKSLLDLGCGPGLYTERLAKLGHRCVGIDIAPAAIAYARDAAAKSASGCAYVQGDIRSAALGGPYDAALFLFGEFNAFAPPDAKALLARTARALKPGGSLVIEAHTSAYVEHIGRHEATWTRAPYSVFADEPHLWLKEAFWDPDTHVAIERYFVVGAGADAAEYVNTTQGYRREEYELMLHEAGFDRIDVYPSLAAEDEAGFWVFVARV